MSLSSKHWLVPHDNDTSTLPNRQGWLIKRLIVLGYPEPLANGICHGIAHMAMQAMLINEFEQFKQRLLYINGIKVDTLKRKMDDIAKRRLKGKAKLKSNEQDLIDVKAFFDGVLLYQNPTLTKDLFEKNPMGQNAMLSAPYAASVKHEKGIQELRSYSGSYNVLKLHKYLSLLGDFLSEQSKKFDQPFSIVLSNVNHSISIKFDPKNNSWLLVDANKLKLIQTPLNKIEMTKAVMKAFNYSIFQPAIFTTHIYAQTENKETNEAYQKFIDENLQNTDDWKILHNPCDKQQIHQKDSWGATWLSLASKLGGQTDTVKTLLENGANPNQMDAKGNTPLLMASAEGNFDAVKTLLEHKANPNQANAKSNTPLLLASVQGNLDIVTALLKNGANPNQIDAKGNTPLLMASAEGNFDAVKTLLEHKANPNQANASGITPFLIAAQEGHLSIVEVLLKSNVDLNIAFRTDAKDLREFAKDTKKDKAVEEFIQSQKNPSQIFMMPEDIALVLGHDKIATCIIRQKYTIELGKCNDDDRKQAIQKIISESDDQTLLQLRRVDQLILQLLEIEKTYKSNTFFRSENQERTKQLAQLKKCAKDAYKDFATSNNVTESINTLINQVEAIKAEVIGDHQKNSPVLSKILTSSRLAREISNVPLRDLQHPKKKF